MPNPATKEYKLDVARRVADPLWSALDDYFASDMDRARGRRRQGARGVVLEVVVRGARLADRGDGPDVAPAHPSRRAPRRGPARRIDDVSRINWTQRCRSPSEGARGVALASGGPAISDMR